MCLDQLILTSSFDEVTIKQESTLTAADWLGDKALHATDEADSYLCRVLSTATVPSHKNSTKGRAPKRPLVCIPCKKRFTRRSNLDQHNRLVHNTDIRYSCDDCHKTFSRRDHIARHVRNGHCPGQSATTADTHLLAELSMCLFTC